MQPVDFILAALCFFIRHNKIFFDTSTGVDGVNGTSGVLNQPVL